MAENVVKLAGNHDVAKAISDERVFWAVVNRAIRAGKNYALTVEVPLAIKGQKSVPGIIYVDEMDSDTEHPNASWLIGMRIPFTIKAVDTEKNMLICSRKAAQQLLKTQYIPELNTGKTLEGTILGFTNFGAFVEVNGLVGMLRNADYSSDYSRVNERYRSRDKITVKCKSVSPDAPYHIVWEAATKYRRTTPFVCDLEVGAMVLGRVIEIKNFAQSIGVFVRLEGGQELDVLCSMPPEIEIDKNMNVTVRISSIEPGKTEFDRPRLRGRIIALA